MRMYSFLCLLNQQYMSIDRIDSNKGYTNDNVQMG